MAFIDRIISGVTDNIRRSGMLESTTLMATVSAVGTDGTITAVRDVDTFPKVRLMASVVVPAVGDVVEISKTLGGWVCLGRLLSSSAPRIQSGTAVTPAPATVGNWTSVEVTFPAPFANVPNVVATTAVAIGTSDQSEIGTANRTTTGFQLRYRRTTPSNPSTTHCWLATDY